MLNLAYPAATTGRDMLRRIPTLTKVCGALAQLGVEVITLQRFSRNEDISLDGVQYHLRRDARAGGAGNSARPLTSARPLLALARAWQPDILHVNGLIFPMQVAQARAMLGRKVRIVVQHHGELPTSPRLRVLQRLCLRFADAFIFNGADNAESWRAAGIIRANQPVFEAVEGSCDFEMMPREEARRVVGVGASGSPMVLWVGRLHPRKDPLTALEGFAVAIASLPDAQLYMIFGEDVLLPQIKARLAQQSELAPRVHLIGKVEHGALPAWYSAADIFLTSSPAEGSNYALIESMSCGVLPACSDIAPHRYIVSDHGVRWQAGSATACAQALIQARPMVTATTRTAIRAHFEQHLSFAAIATQLSATYRLISSMIEVNLNSAATA
jgi:glycosyltransferase involved in cell wall biosynthesis